MDQLARNFQEAQSLSYICISLFQEMLNAIENKDIKYIMRHFATKLNPKDHIVYKMMDIILSSDALLDTRNKMIECYSNYFTKIDPNIQIRVDPIGTPLCIYLNYAEFRFMSIVLCDQIFTNECNLSIKWANNRISDLENDLEHLQIQSKKNHKKIKLLEEILENNKNHVKKMSELYETVVFVSGKVEQQLRHDFGYKKQWIEYANGKLVNHIG